MANNLEWKKGTIEHPLMPEGGRSLDDYEKTLGFRRQDLEGIRVLDLGCGPEIKLARGLKNAKIDADVVSLSPDFSIENHRLLVKRFAQEYGLVAGIGQDMPFKDNRFDRVLCLNTYDHLPSKRAFVEMVLEIFRVMKDGGIALIGPFETFPDEENKRSNFGINPAYEFLMKSAEIKELLKNDAIRIHQKEVARSGLRKTINSKNGKNFFSPIYRIVVEKGRDDDCDSNIFWNCFEKLKKLLYRKNK
ncbi:MAG: class I SAM-dependent methyltransferase [Candidatus Moranbacteria bacterium]|nr:class I SAM-dependent methyltransferase [Candidatus Moranbacteria bacterium]